MSLLLDARKKIKLALQHNDAHTGTGTQPAGGLSLDNLPAGIPQKNPDESSHAAQRAAPARSTPEGAPPLRGDPRAANLFAAKAAPVRAGGRLGIIPIALISGLVLAAGGGYYVWREISPPPVMQRYNPPPAPRPPEGRVSGGVPFTGAAPATPVANAMPPAAPVAQTAPAPVTSAAATTAAAPAKIVLAENKPARADVSRKKTNRTPRTAAPSDTAAQPLRIKSTQESDAVDPTLLAAYQAYRNGDLRTAWQHYGDVLRKDAKNRDALLGMAAIAQQQSQDAIAVRYYNQVLMLDPRDPIANAGMSALIGTGDMAATESRLKLLLAQQPKPTGTQSSALYFALGNLYAEQSRWGDAQQAYFNACNLEQGNAQFAFNLAVSLDHLGQGKSAAQHYQRALQLDESDNPGFNRAQTQQRINELTAP